MPNLFKRTAGWSWVPDADAVGAPDGALLRAANTIPDASGARVLRRGSRTLQSSVGTRVRSLLSPILQDQKYRFAGADNAVYGGPADGSSLSQLGSNFAGLGDISIGEDAYQAFFARGTTKKKYDGENYYNWGIAAPAVKPSVSAVNAITASVATFDGAGSPGGAESPAFTVNEGAIAFVDGYAASGVVTDGAIEFTPSASPGPGSVASATKDYGEDTDFLDIAGSSGSDTDLFDMRVAMDNPKKVDKIRVMFGLNTGDDPFADDYYYFDFNIKENKDVDLKDPNVNAVAAYNAATDKLLSTLTASEITDVRSPEAAGDIVKKLTSLRGDKSNARTDSEQASPAWGHLTVTRGQFKRAGKTSGRDWSTVRGFKIVYTVISGDKTTAIRFDEATIIGGGSRSLSGTFRVGYRYARRFLDSGGNEVYTELSPMSPVSDKINLAQQSLSITIPESALSAKDAQVDTIWVYLYGGWLDTYYRVAIISSTSSSGLTIDELANPDGDNFDDATERTRLSSHGFTFVQSHTPITTATSPALTSMTFSAGTVTVTFGAAHGWITGDYIQVQGVAESDYNGIFQITNTGANTFTYTITGTPSSPATIAGASITYMNSLLGTPTDAGDQSIVLSLFKSELDALIENEPFEPGAGGPPNNIIGIAGPWRKRLFALTKEGWLYVSSNRNPSSFSVYHAVDLRQYGTPYWVIEAGEHIYVGCSKDVIRIAGSGEIDETGVLLDLYPQEMSAANPPADDSAATDGNAIIFRSGDGPMMMTGATLQPVPFAGTSFLWKGRERHQIEPLNTDTGRFRFEVDNHNLYMLAPEGVEAVRNVHYFDQAGTKTVTVYYEQDHNYATGEEVRFTGSSRSEYNDTFYVTVLTSKTLTFTTSSTRTDTTGSTTPGNVSAYSQGITQPNSIWKYMPTHQQWCRFKYSSNPLSIWREYNGQLIIGTDAGKIIEVEYGTDDDGAGIAVDILTPIDDGGNPFGRKDSADFQIHVNTSGATGTADFIKDGDDGVVSESIAFLTSKNDVYRSAMVSLGTFLKLQLNITGTFTDFAMQSFSVSFRPRPQQFMVLDSGHVVPNTGQSLSWVSHVYLDCYSPVDLQLQIYKNGVLYDTCDIPVTANIRDEYAIVMPRGTKGRRLQFKVVTTNDAGEGDIGFEPYSLSVKNAISGKVTELPFNRGDQGND